MRKILKSISTLLMTVALIATVNACGETKGERAISGGAIGAGAGAAVGAVTGGSVLGGAVIGGAAGAATGALTDEDDIDLGEEPIDLEDNEEKK
jgi:osmotically inducible lipoprotein OsmB